MAGFAEQADQDPLEDQEPHRSELISRKLRGDVEDPHVLEVRQQGSLVHPVRSVEQVGPDAEEHPQGEERLCGMLPHGPQGVSQRGEVDLARKDAVGSGCQRDHSANLQEWAELYIRAPLPSNPPPPPGGGGIKKPSPFVGEGWVGGRSQFHDTQVSSAATGILSTKRIEEPWVAHRD